MDQDELPFPSPSDKKNPQKRKTAIAFRIMTASQRIRGRNGWRQQLSNDQMISEWAAEAIENGLKPDEFSAVLDQLKYFDSLATNSMEVGMADGTRQSSDPVTEQLKNEFVAAVDNFSAKSDRKDYDPGTNDLVVNLLDPRLYCSVSGVTRVTDFDLDAQNCLEQMGNGESNEDFLTPRLVRIRQSFPLYLRQFQLLPAEFHVSETGQANINSYINNLHPENDAALYLLIERVFTLFVPLFNGVLHDLLHDKPTEVLRGHKKQILDNSSTKTYLHGRDVQVIVRMKSIELTSETPAFAGGDWHIEGEEEEHIVASGIYCFQTENITDSCVDLRQLRGKNQEMGALPTPEGSLIAFPNICQHRSGSFELVDKSRRGFRKILVFFLIDPTIRIRSTRNVPPQQLDWFDANLLQIPPFDRLDAYGVRGITSLLECPFSLEQAIAYRNALIKWRKGERLVFGTD